MLNLINLGKKNTNLKSNKFDNPVNISFKGNQSETIYTTILDRFNDSFLEKGTQVKKK